MLVRYLVEADQNDALVIDMAKGGAAEPLSINAAIFNYVGNRLIDTALNK